MTSDRSNNQDSIAQLLVGAIGFGMLFAVLFMLYNYSWGESVLNFSNLQIAGIVSSMILGAGITYYNHRNESGKSLNFLKSEIILMAVSIFIVGTKMIYFKVSEVKHFYYYGTPAIVVGSIYIITAVSIVWFFVVKKR